MTQPLKVAPEPLRQLLEEILRADGCSAEESDAVACHLVDACLVGHDSHGAIRITRYHEWLSTGQLMPQRSLRAVNESPSFVHFDGQNGMGQWLAQRACDQGIGMAKRHGCGIVAMRRGGHIGRVGTYAEQSCAEGIVSIHFVNVAGSRLVAPFGSVQRCISTAPVAVGVPNTDGDDFILDFSTARVAEGKALVAARGGAELPNDALITSGGELSNDPRALYGESFDEKVADPRRGTGALRTMGEHKGSGLALACELLAGALTGGGTNGPNEHSFGNGMLSIFMDPKQYDDTGTFEKEVADYIRFVQESIPTTAGARVQIPGDKERMTRRDRIRNGIPLAPEVVDAINTTAADTRVQRRLQPLDN